MTEVDEPPTRRSGRRGRSRPPATSRRGRPWSSARGARPTPCGEYLQGVVGPRSRAGESGVLPVVGGLLLISILFQSLNSNFLTAGNLVNLLVQGAVFMLLAMGEVFALLLGEIDLSIGFVSGIGGIITAELVKQSATALAVVGRHRRGPARLRGRSACCRARSSPASGCRRSSSPWPGLLGLAGRDAADPRARAAPSRSTTTVINDLASGNLTPPAELDRHDRAGRSLFGLLTWIRDARRRRSGPGRAAGRASPS